MLWITKVNTDTIDLKLSKNDAKIIGDLLLFILSNVSLNMSEEDFLRFKNFSEKLVKKSQ